MGRGVEERWGETTTALSQEPDVAGKWEIETEICGTIFFHAVVSVSQPCFCIIFRACGVEGRSRLVMKPKKAIIVLQGRYVGRNAVIIRPFDEGTWGRAYGNCQVGGISKYSKKVIHKESAKKMAKKSRAKAFINLVNYNHIMPARYTLDVDLKEVVPPDVLQSRDKKITDAKEVKARFE